MLGLGGALAALAAGACDVGDVSDLDFCDPGECPKDQVDAGADGGATSGGTDPVVPIDRYEAALRIYGDDEACVACVRASCDAEATACTEVAACATNARCRAGCRDPACIQLCEEPYPQDANPTEPLERCVVDGCLDECRVGQDFDCVGEFDWPRPESSEPVVLRAQLIVSAEMAPVGEGILARLCRWQEPDCAHPVDVARTDPMGFVDLAYTPMDSFGRGLQALDGYVESTDPDNEPRRVVPALMVPGDIPVPEFGALSNEYPVQHVVNSDDGRTFLWGILLGIDVDSSLGRMWGVVQDCRASSLASARGVNVRVEPDAGGTRYAYGSTPTLTETDLTGLFQAGPLAPGLATVTVSFEGKVVSWSNFLVRADFTTGVFLRPLTSPSD